MGWVSCLEDTQKRLDDFLNSIQDFTSDSEYLNWQELNEFRQTVANLQENFYQILEKGTDPNNTQIIDLEELKEKYKNLKLQTSELQNELSNERKKCLDMEKIIKNLSNELTKCNQSLNTEIQISERTTAMYHKELNRREELENKLFKLQQSPHKTQSSSKKRKKR